jgi:hypothetical protein
LNGIQEDEPGLGGQLEAVERSVGDLGNRQHALRGLGLGGARELERAHLRDVDTALLEHAKEGGATGGIGELRRHKGTAQGEAGSHQLLHGSDPFGREQLLALARFPAPEVTS